MDTAFPLLLIDAGNSRVKWAVRTEDGKTRRGGPVDRQLDTDAETQLLAQWQTLPTPASIWISNVAGRDLAQRIEALLLRRWPSVPRTTIAARASQSGVVNHYIEPSKLGSDRWAGMIGARAAYPGEPLLIATLGTATTLDALNAEGHFVGGLIAPGWTLMMRSLGEHTAQLPVLSATDARRLSERPASVSPADKTAENAAAVPADAMPAASASSPFFAQTTSNAIVEGCRLAQAGLIESAWRAFCAESGKPVRCIVAGGAADEVTRILPMPVTRHDDLVLEGLTRMAVEAAAEGRR